MVGPLARREAFPRGTVAAGATLAGCVGARSTDPLLRESFEWETHAREGGAAASIGAEVSLSAFEWRIERSREQAAEGKEEGEGRGPRGAHGGRPRRRHRLGRDVPLASSRRLVVGGVGA